VPLEELLQRVEEEALPETPGPREEGVFFLLDQPQGKRGFIHIEVALFTDFPKILNVDRQLLTQCPYASLWNLDISPGQVNARV
jgi:hypothetical protein